MSRFCRMKRTKKEKRARKEARVFRSSQPATSFAVSIETPAWTRLDGWRFYQRYNVAPYEHRRFARAVRRRLRRALRRGQQ